MYAEKEGVEERRNVVRAIGGTGKTVSNRVGGNGGRMI